MSEEKKGEKKNRRSMQKMYGTNNAKVTKEQGLVWM